MLDKGKANGPSCTTSIFMQHQCRNTSLPIELVLALPFIKELKQLAILTRLPNTGK